MIDSTAGGTSSAIPGGQSAGAQQGFAGQPEAGAERVTGADSAAGQPDSAGIKPKGNPETASEVSSPQNGGLAKVFAGQPEAGAERVTGADNAAGQPDSAGIKPKGNPETQQSNDNASQPVWLDQLPKKLIEKLAADPESMARLAAFKNIEDLVQNYLDAAAHAGRGQLSLPGADSAPADVQAFWERMGKPKEAAGYPFAQEDPALAAAFFGANLTQAQAQAIYDANLQAVDDARAQALAAQSRDFASTDALLRKDFGDRYEEAVALMGRGLGNNPATGALSPIAQALKDAGLAGKPEIVRAFIEYGRATSESAAPAGASPIAGQPRSVMDGGGYEYKT